MKIVALCTTLLLIGLFSNAQTEDFGAPKTWSGKLNKVKNFHTLPHVDKEEQLEIDSINRANGFEKTIRFGYEHHVEVDIFEKGTKTVTPRGDVYTLYGLECKEALSINVIFDKFKLSENARLYLLDENKREYIGAHTSNNNNRNEVLGTEIIRSDRVLIEVFEPKDEVGQSELVLGTVVHGYKDLDVLMSDYMKNLNGSGDCNIDVNCPQGEGWENQIKSVARIVAGGGFCTGSLVHNTSGDIIPYFLTARHCGTNVANWSFRFRWESPENGTSCATTANSVNGPTFMTISGATLRASNTNADFSLLELNNEPDPQWDIFYNGWDNSDATNITRTTGVHHPAGDIKKICHSEMAPNKTTQSFNGDPNAEFWFVPSWSEGVTEPGSSGSPLFNQNGKVVGVLSAGAAACNGTSNNGEHDIYGRFGVAWDDLPENSNQLKHWLDPNNTGQTIINGVNPLQPEFENDVTAVDLEGADGVICGNTVYPYLTITNSGSDTLMSFEIEYSFNGNTYTDSWSGQLTTNQTETIQMMPFTVSGGQYTYEVILSEPNGVTDENPADNTLSSQFISSGEGEVIKMDLTPDCYGEEIEWEVKDENDLVWYSGGPYNNTTNPEMIEYKFCLAPGCYELTITDDFGDGMNGSVENDCSVDGEMQLYRNNNNEMLGEIDESNVDYGEEITFDFCANNTASTNKFDLENSVKLYPNPTDNILNISFIGLEGDKTIILKEITGKIIEEINVNNDIHQLNMNRYAKGAYIVQINHGQNRVVKKVIKQ